jgi:hypothetical protein
MTSPNSQPVDLDGLDPETRRVVEKFLTAEPVRRRQPPKKVGVRQRPAPAIPVAPRRYKDVQTAREAVDAGRHAADERWEKRRAAREAQRRMDRGLPPIEGKP